MFSLHALQAVSDERGALVCLQQAFTRLIADLQNVPAQHAHRRDLGQTQAQTRLAIVPQKHSFLSGSIKHMHPYPELILSCVGRGVLDLFSGSFALPLNSLIVTPRGIAHAERPANRRHSYANIIVGCTPGELSGHLRISRPGQMNGHIFNRFVISDSRMQRVSRYFAEACSAHGEEQQAPQALSTGLCLAACAAILPIIEDALKQTDAADHQPRPAQHTHVITLARAYAEQHFTNAQLRISDIARAVGCSADYLSHRFHQLHGQHLSRWITEQRLLFACSLLRDSNLGIEEVARAAGFNDPGYFSRCFRNANGLSPRTWRASFIAS